MAYSNNKQIHQLDNIATLASGMEFIINKDNNSTYKVDYSIVNSEFQDILNSKNTTYYSNINSITQDDFSAVDPNNKNYLNNLKDFFDIQFLSGHIHKDTVFNFTSPDLVETDILLYDQIVDQSFVCDIQFMLTIHAKDPSSPSAYIPERTQKLLFNDKFVFNNNSNVLQNQGVYYMSSPVNPLGMDSSLRMATTETISYFNSAKNYSTNSVFYPYGDHDPNNYITTDNPSLKFNYKLYMDGNKLHLYLYTDSSILGSSFLFFRFNPNTSPDYPIYAYNLDYTMTINYF